MAAYLIFVARSASIDARDVGVRALAVIEQANSNVLDLLLMRKSFRQ